MVVSSTGANFAVSTHHRLIITHREPTMVPRSVLMALLALNGISACYGGWMLASDPTGATMHLSTTWLAASPFEQYLIPGVILLVVLGVGSIVALVLLAMRRPFAPYLTMMEGAATMLWIITQVAMVQLFSWLQVLYVIVGALILLGGRSLTKQ